MKPSFQSLIFGASLGATLMGMCPSAHGLGVRLPDQDAFATGRGEAFVATADNPSAIYYNPAGITQLEGQNVRGGFYSIATYDHEYSPAGAAHTVDSIQAVPQFFYTAKINETPISLGMGVYSPYGLSQQWPKNTSFDTLGTKGSIQYICFNPVVAWQVASNFSIAAGPTINWAQTDLRLSVVPSALQPGTELRFKGSDNTLGMNLGFLFQLAPKISIGVSYRSQTVMGFRGPASVNGAGDFAIPNNSIGTDAAFTFPQNIIGGISYRPTTNWNVEFDVDWTEWSRLKNVPLKSSPINAFGVVNVPINLPFNWQDSCFFEWGVTRYFDNGWHGSAGYIFSENSVPDASFNPLIPDGDRHIWSLGVGRKGEHFSWDIAYQLAWGPPRTIDSGPGPTAPSTTQNHNGTYEALSHAIIISVGYHF